MASRPATRCSSALWLAVIVALALPLAAMAQFTEVNHALEIGTFATSSSGSDGGSDPSRTIDGNTDGNWANGSVWRSQTDQPPQFQVQLPGEREIGRVVFWPRTDCCNGQRTDVQIIIRDLSFNVVFSNFWSGVAPVPLAWNIAPPATGYLLEVSRKNANGKLSCAELEAIAPYTDVSINVTQPVADATVEESRSVTFGPVAAEVVGAPQDKLSIQWQLNGVDIPGATGDTYTTPIQAMANNGDQYTARFKVSGIFTDSTGTLTVQKDVDPPVVESSNGLGNTVGILFDWLMDPASAGDKANYSVSGGTVTSAQLAGDGRSVALVVSGLAGDSYTVTINGVKDLGGNPIVADTETAGTVDTSLTTQDIGQPDIPGLAYSVAPGQYTLQGGGVKQFNNDGDEMHFASAPITGDFDKRVQVRNVSASDPTDAWARGGLMVRGNNASDTSRALKITVANPEGQNRVATRVRSEDGVPGWTDGVGLTGVGYSRQDRNQLTGVADNLPNQWIRLQRVGNNFNMYVGTDGETWALVGQRYIIDMPETLQVGMYAAAAMEGSTATAVFDNYSDVTSDDTTPPTLVSTGTLDKEYVGVKFNETINWASAKDTAHYTLSEGTVDGVMPGLSGDAVYLMVSGLTSDSYTVTVNGVEDSAGNAIAADSQVEGSVSDYQGVDVGRFLDANNRPQQPPADGELGDSPYMIGKYIALSSGSHVEVDILAGGANIWQHHYFHFVEKPVSGDFDMMVNVERSSQAAMGGAYFHGGLMARDGLYRPGMEYTDDGTKVRYEMNTTYGEGSQERAALVLYRTSEEDANEGVGKIVGTGTQDANGWVGRYGNLRASNAAGDPVANSSPLASRWLRLKREGQVFTYYWSYDGANWNQYDQRDRTDSPLPDTLLVGYAGQINDSCCGGAAVNGRPGLYSQVRISSLGDFQVNPPEISITDNGDGTVTINWTAGELQEAATANGPYTGTGDTSGSKTVSTADQAYYKAVVNP